MIPTAGFISACWRHTVFANSHSKVPPVALASGPGCTAALNLQFRGVGRDAVLRSSLLRFSVKVSTVDMKSFRSAGDTSATPAASLGGFERQYQIVIDSDKLVGFGLTVTDITRSVRDANAEVGARVLELAGREYVLRGRGYVKALKDLEQSSRRSLASRMTSPRLKGDRSTGGVCAAAAVGQVVTHTVNRRATRRPVRLFMTITALHARATGPATDRSRKR